MIVAICAELARINRVMNKFTGRASLNVFTVVI